MKLQLITYGLGNKYDPNKWRNISNKAFFVKPNGGLWASPINSSYGWHEWCKDEDFGDLTTSFQFEFEGNVLTIDCFEDMVKIPFFKHFSGVECIDFEAIEKSGIDAISLTDNGQVKTRFTSPNLYGWDCECVLVLNKDKIILSLDSIEKV